MRHRLVLLPATLVAAGLLASAVAGCGGGGSAELDPATLAPPGAPVFIEATVTPEGSLRTNVEALAKTVGGIDDLENFIVEQLEKASIGDSGGDVDFEKDVRPWLGDRAGIYIGGYDGDDFQTGGAAVATTDPGATQEFIDKRVAHGEDPVEQASYSGIDYIVEPEDEVVYGVVGDFFVWAEDEGSFKAMVDASDGDSLAGQASYSSAVSEIPADRLVDVFVDVGRLVEESEDEIDSEDELLLEAFGLAPEEATAVATLVPGSDRIEIEFSTDVSGEEPVSVDASELLGSLPATAVAAIASSELGPRFEQGIDRIDREGIESDDLAPGELSEALELLGVDPRRLGGSVGDAALFAEGGGRTGRAQLVVEMRSRVFAAATVGALGAMVSSNDSSKVTAIGDESQGFEVRNPDLAKPLAIAARGRQLVVVYGPGAVARALGSDSGETLAGDPTYRESVAALDGEPIAAFFDGPGVLRLASGLIPDDAREGFREAQPYLEAIKYGALTVEASGDRTTAKLIAGIGK